MIKLNYTIGNVTHINYDLMGEIAQTKILIYKNEFVLNLRYKIKVFSRGFYLNGLNSLE